MTSGRIVSEEIAVSGMQMLAATMKNGARRILGLPGSVEQQANGTLVYVYVQGSDAVSFENIVLTTASANSIGIGSGTTGINAVLNGSATEQMYDLNGRKVNAAKKGIVIIGGKKVVVK